MNRRTWLSYGLGLLILASCGRKTVSTTGIPVADELAIQDINFDYLTSSSKIRYRNDDQNVSATANIRVKKDSIIWISVTPGFGIEAARGLITRDSVSFINRLDKEYSTFSFKELSNKFNFDLSYDLLQAVLLGDMPRPLTANDEVEKKTNHFLVRQQKGPITIDSFVDARLMKVNRVAVVDETRRNGQGRGKNTLNLQYEEFKKINEELLPFKNVASLDYRSKGRKRRTQIDIQHRKADIVDEALRFPFSIPSSYARK